MHQHAQARKKEFWGFRPLFNRTHLPTTSVTENKKSCLKSLKPNPIYTGSTNNDPPCKNKEITRYDGQQPTVQGQQSGQKYAWAAIGVAQWLRHCTTKQGWFAASLAEENKKQEHSDVRYFGTRPLLLERVKYFAALCNGEPRIIIPRTKRIMEAIWV